MGQPLGDAMCESNEGKAYLIVDAALFDDSKKQASCTSLSTRYGKNVDVFQRKKKINSS
jgi:hypothetical protein